MNDEQKSQIIDLITMLQDTFKFPGLSLAIIEHGEIVLKEGFGHRNVEMSLPMDENTIFGIGSISKTFTAIGIMQLLDQNKLSLDDPISKYLDINWGHPENPITIHHLLIHSSGMPNIDGTDIPLLASANMYRGSISIETEEDFMKYLNDAKEEQLFPPGKVHMYSNEGYYLLGRIISKISGLSFSEYMEEFVFGPLHLTRTMTKKEKFFSAAEDNRIQCYIPLGEGKFQPHDYIFHPISMALGGIFSTAKDLSTVVMMLLDEGKFAGKQFLQQKTVALMKKEYINIDFDYNGQPTHYGYGLMTFKSLFGHKMVFHSGDIGIASGQISMIPDLDTGIVLGINTSSGMETPITMAIGAILMGQDWQEANQLITATQKFETLCGKYQAYSGQSTVNVSIEEQVPFVVVTDTVGNKSKYPLITKDLEKLEFAQPVLLSDHNRDVKFFIDGEKIHLKIERHIFHKV